MTCNAICIDPKQVHEIWPKVSELIKLAMQRGGLGSYASVERDVLSGKNLLWLALEEKELKGAAVTSLEQTEWDKSCVLVACGGKDVEQWIGCLDRIEQFAKAEGCNRMLIYGREGWLRLLPSYRPMRVVLERQI